MTIVITPAFARFVDANVAEATKALDEMRNGSLMSYLVIFSANMEVFQYINTQEMYTACRDRLMPLYLIEREALEIMKCSSPEMGLSLALKIHSSKK